jgi:aspartyl protease family protein
MAHRRRRTTAAPFGVDVIRGALLFALAGVALALATLSHVPDFVRAGAPIAPAPGPSASARPDEVAPAKETARQTAGYRETLLEADARGQYAADTLVDGAPVRMMVDTGASAVVISASTAARIGIVAGPGPKWRVKTANGETTASPAVLRTLSFGGLYMNDVQALILAPEAGEVNLLGATFLKRLLSIEQRDGILILRQ